MDSGLQYVRTSAKTCGVSETRCPNNMDTPFRESFFRCHDKGLAIPFSRRMNLESLQKSPVWHMVIPLTLTLEPKRWHCDQGLPLESHAGKPGISDHHITDYDCLSHIFPDLILLARLSCMRFVQVLTLSAVFFYPCRALLNSSCHICLHSHGVDLGHIGIFVSHAQVGLEEVGIHD